MLQVRKVEELRGNIGDMARWRKAGERIGFVPTMGALHEGHLSLVGIARKHADRVVASVFVNPTQFGPNEDFGRYPRQPEKDAGMLAAAGCDLLFLPDVDTMYPPGHTVYVDLGNPSETLEGVCRPGHFRGVATVVALLFNLVQPDVAVFGEKDAQQLAVIRRMVRDLHIPVEIVPAPTIREADGLAMSSRNAYLSPEERKAAAVLHRSLRNAEAAIQAGERRGDEVRRILSETLNSEPLARVEYAEVVDAESFQPVEKLRGRLVLPLAVRVGGTRLIDNLQLAVE
ncbi:MAG TPA: pantoate--beta-alanine ligase [Thermoanaerobaculia bacterium]|nr:pantoate--beta-alanine ligase [Thermoanaerobaculia bacterium]